MNFLKNNAIKIICLLSFFTAFLYNQLNLNSLPTDSLRANQTVKTSDDPSYLRPPENWIKNNEWKDNSIGKQSYFIRTPGYGLFYWLWLKLVDYPAALSLLKLAQLLLFACSVYWLYYIATTIIQHKKTALIIASIYGLSPFAIGFLFYTLTEAISPALLLLYVFLLFKAQAQQKLSTKNSLYIFASLTFAYLLIVRAPLGFFGFLLPIFIVYDYWKQGYLKVITKLFLFGLIALSFTAIWQIRNYKITNQFVGLHAIYYADGNSIYRPPFKAFWGFVGGWAQEGNVAHSYMVPMWQAAIKGDTSIIYIENALKTFPNEVVTYFGKERLINVFRSYQEAVLFQKPYYDKGISIPIETIDKEAIVVNQFNQLTEEYKTHFWLDYYIKSPVKVFKVMAFHSNLSLYIFQHIYRGNILMETIRFLFYAVHFLCFLMLLVGLFFINKNDWKQGALTLIIFTYVFYLCFFQRGIEERYTLPILPFLLIGLGYGSKRMLILLRTKS
jgi:hypothetical protein